MQELDEDDEDEAEEEEEDDDEGDELDEEGAEGPCLNSQPRAAPTISHHLLREGDGLVLDEEDAVSRLPWRKAWTSLMEAAAVLVMFLQGPE